MEKKDFNKPARVSIILKIFLFSLTLFFISVTSAYPMAITETEHFIFKSENENLCNSLSKIGESELKRISTELKHLPGKKIKVTAYSNPRNFKKVKEAYGVNPNALGFAVPSRYEIFILIESFPLNYIFSHELSHVVFFDSLPENIDIPLWFIEGLAIFQSGYFKNNFDPSIILSGDIITENDIFSSTGIDKEESILGYNIVEYILKNFGNSALFSIVYELQKGKDFESAWIAATGLRPEEAKNQIADHFNRNIKELPIYYLRYLPTIIFGTLGVGLTVYIYIKIQLELAKKDDEEEDFMLNSDDTDKYN